MKLDDVPNTILVASGKGGVGKTTVSSDIARVAESLGYTTGLIDADISTPNSLQVLGGEDVDISGQRLATHDAITPPTVNGVQVVSQGNVLPDDVPVLRGGTWRAQEVVDYIRNVEWDDDTDLVVIDTPPGTGEELQVIASEVSVTHAYVVTIPHPSSVRDATKTHEFFEQAGVPHDAILNMAYIPAADILSHVADGADLQSIGGVGDATEEQVRDALRENTDDLHLFAYSDDYEPGVDADLVTTVPYASDHEDRAASYEQPVQGLLDAQEVEA